MGTIYTFYSYKGGVGRSMCLANVATLLGRWGRRVLVIDWDLEAPGIEAYFRNFLAPGVSSERGLLEIIEGFSLGSSSQPVSWRECVVDVPIGEGANIALITGGSRKSRGAYIRKLQELDWGQLFKLGFGNFLEEMRKEWISEFDFVLVDSRTGFTDMGGICTIFLPDVLVLLFTANRQSLEGVLEVLEKSREARSRLPVDRSSLVAIPVAARDESRTEYALAREWRKNFADDLRAACADWLPRGKTAEDWFESLRLPYIPYWSFGEPLPVLEESPKDTQSLSYGYYILARLIDAGLDWEEAMEEPVIDVPVAESAEDLFGFEIYPYRGLLPFEEVDAPFYFGRESFVHMLRSAVEGNSLTGLVGPSGSGKTSLVNAGLLPQLRESNTRVFWHVLSMRPGSHPVFSLASCLVRLLASESSPEDQKLNVSDLAATIMLREASLESISVQASRQAGKSGPLLLVVDQWEELYTLAQDNESERERFVEEILSATRSNWVSVLILFRADFYGRVMERSDLRGRLQGDRLIHLPEMSPDDLRRAVVEPARKVGHSFDAGLVEEILEDLEQQPGQLPLLEFVLAVLWNERDQERRLLRSSYVSMGGLRGALARKADDIARTLPEAEVRRLFLRLVRVEGESPVTRRRVHLSELEQATREVASRFTESRLLVTGWDSKTGEEIVEVAHEALIHHWRRLRAWLEADRAFLIWREQLEYDIAEWMEKGKETSFLLTEGPLEVAEHWSGQNAEDLSSEAHSYIRLSIEKRERDKRSRRLIRNAAAVFATLIVTLVGLAFYLREGRARARSAALAAEAVRMADRKLDLALLLALQAGKIEETPEARGATLFLAARNASLQHFLYLPLTDSKQNSLGQEEARLEGVLAVAFGPSDLVATGGKGRIFLWNSRAGTLYGRPLETGEASQVVSIAFSPDGSLLAAGSEGGGQIRLWNIQENRQLDPIPVGGSAQNLSVQNLTFDLAGRRLAGSTPSGIHIWDIRQNAKVRRIPREAPPTNVNWISSLAFGPSGELAWATADGRLWRTGEGQPIQLLAEAGGTVLGVTFSPEGSLLSAGSSLLRWDPRSGSAVGGGCNLLADAEDEVISVAFSRDKRFVASGHLDSKIRLWDLTKKGCPRFATLAGHSGFIWTMAFGEKSPGKSLLLVSGGEEGEVILWEGDPVTPPFSVPLSRQPPYGFASLGVSLDGGLVAVADSVGQVTLYDGKTREKLDSKKRERSSTSRLAFSGDGRVLATGGVEGDVVLWDTSQRHLRVSGLLRVKGGEDSVRSLALSQDGAWVAAGTRAGRLLVWQPAVSNALFIPPQELYKGPVLAMAFVSEASLVSRVLPFLKRKQKMYLVIGGTDGRLIVWDLEEGRKIDTKAAHSNAVTSLAVSADGLLATGSLDQEVRFWRLEDNGLSAEDRLFLGKRISDLDLSPQGDLLVAAVQEGANAGVVLWDLRARTQIGTGFETPILRRVAFGSSGQSLFLAGEGVASWWDLRSETWTARACDIVRRGFSPLERERYLKPSDRPVSCLDAGRVRQ